MSVLNWLALPLSVVLWVISQYIGHGVAMASSAPPQKGSPEDLYLHRVEVVWGIAAVGALLTFISQLIPGPLVKTGGLIILVISFLAVAILRSGFLRFRLPKPDVLKEDNLIYGSRNEEQQNSAGPEDEDKNNDKL